MNTSTYAFLAGLLLALVVGRIYYVAQHPTMHPIGYSDTDEEVHVHSDFIVYLDGTAYDFTADKYQSRAGHIMSDHIHLHDNNDDIIHRHDQGITLGDFFGSLGFTLTNECIMTDSGSEFCNSDSKRLALFINGEATTSLADYVNQEEDRLLIYYGNPQAEILPFLLDEVTDKSCIYSGTCPKRGIAPPEECGLTCEL